MISLKKILEKHLFSFINENKLNSLREKMIETITKAEYELHDVIERIVDVETHSACTEVEHENSHLHEIITDLESDFNLLNEQIDKLKDDFFVPKTLQDEFKLQWIKDNWDKIPSI